MTTTTYTCPDWCTLPADHGWDSIHGEYDDLNARRSRGHQGPYFGDMVSVGSIEYDDGQHLYDVTVLPDRLVEDAQSAIELAGHLIAAAAWVRSREDDDRDVRERNAFELGRDYERGLTQAT